MFFHTVKILILSAFFLFWSTSSTFAASYYLDSAAGNDSNNGTTSGTPWQSLDKIRALTLQPGDTVYFKNGSSWDAGMQNGTLSNNLGLEIDDSGTAGNPITFTTYGVGASPIFTNSYSGTIYTRAITVSGSYNVIEEFTIKNASEACIYITSTGTHNTLDILDLSACSMGAVIAGSNNTLSSSLIHDTVMLVNTNNNGDDDSGAVGIAISGSSNTIRGNTIEDNLQSSYDYGTDGSGIEFYSQGPAIQDNIIMNNHIRDNDTVTEVGGQSNPTISNNIFRYNILQNNSRLSVVHLGGTFGANVTGLKFHNNTIYEKTSEWAGGVQSARPSTRLMWFSASPSSSTLELKNNIFYISGFYEFSNYQSFTHDYNLYYLPTGTTGMTLSAHESTADPLFVSVGGTKDFNLSSGSPAIDQGTNLSYTADYVNTGVAQGSAPDFGAYEYITPGPTPNPDATPGTQWYLAEGFTGGANNFKTNILIQNPNNSAASVTVTYMVQGASNVTENHTAPANSRLTVGPPISLSGYSFSTQITSDLPVLVERTMYWDSGGITRVGGTASQAIKNPATTWYLAEGFTGGANSFKTNILIQNPNLSTAELTVTYMVQGESPVVENYTVGSRKRSTIGPPISMLGKSFSTKIVSTVGIVVERTMYWNSGGITRVGGTASQGLTLPTDTWYLPEGFTGGSSNFKTNILIQNPQSSSTTVTVVFFVQGEGTVSQEVTVPANGRATTGPPASLAGKSFATQVSSTQDIVVERTMYWDSGGISRIEGHASSGLPTVATSWYLPEGFIGGSNTFRTNILIMNPNGGSTDVTVTYMLSGGGTIVENYTVAGTARATIGPPVSLANQSFSTRVTSTGGGVVVERTMYWDSGSYIRVGGTAAAGVEL